MGNLMPAGAWVRLRKRLFKADRHQPSSAAGDDPTPSHIASAADRPKGAAVLQPADTVQALQRRLAEQDAALFYAKAALAAEIRERQTAELELQRAVEQERCAMAGRLAASVAHEINTPLQTVQTTLELMRSLPPEEHGALLTDALDEIQRVSRIVRQLLDLYRPATEGAVDLPVLLERVLVLLGRRIQEQQVDVRLQATTVQPALGRADELTQVLINLVVNALDAMPAGGVLAFLVAPAAEVPGQLSLEVADTGTGVAPELHERIFDPFVTTKANGMGLGLAISRQIMERHGGMLTLAHSENGGSTFRMLLPVYPAEAWPGSEQI
jgi:signal transduction histidine kinase